MRKLATQLCFPPELGAKRMSQEQCGGRAGFCCPGRQSSKYWTGFCEGVYLCCIVYDGKPLKPSVEAGADIRDRHQENALGT